MPVEEFLRRFLLHVLPRGFVRIRNFGFLANRQRTALLPLCVQLLNSSPGIATQHTVHFSRRRPSCFLDLSYLRWTHESCREAYGGPGSASFSAPDTSMCCMNPHLRARPLSVLRHQPAFSALFAPNWVILTRCTSHFTLTLPTQPAQTFSRSTTPHASMRSPNLYSPFSTIQIP
jgi:hypothetical protein